MSLFAIVVGILGAIGLGMFGAIGLQPRWSRTMPGGRAEFSGLSILLGVAGVSWSQYLWSFAGGRLSPAWSWTLTAAGCCGFIVAWRRGRFAKNEVASRSALACCCGWLVALLLVSVLVETLLTPQRFWDERAIFAIKGKVLFLDGTIDSESLSHPEFVQGHPRYPLLLPLAESHVYELLGDIDDRWAKVVFPLLFGGLVLTFAGVLSRRCGPGCGWLFALLLAATPVLFPYELGVISGQADAAVACFHGTAALFIWDFLKSSTVHRDDSAIDSSRSPVQTGVRYGILIGSLAASAAFTKDEGIAFLMTDAIALSIACAWGRWWERRRGQADHPAAPRRIIAWLLPLAASAAVAAVLLGPWFWHRRQLPTTTEMQYLDRISIDLLMERLEAVKWLVPHLLRRMFLEWRDWGLQWWMLVAALLTMPRRALAPEQLFLLLNILGALAALILAGMIAPVDLHDHIGGSSHRYLMQLAPLALLFVAGQWGAPDPRYEARPDHEWI